VKGDAEPHTECRVAHLHPAALPGHNSRSRMTAAITQQPLHPTSIRGARTQPRHPVAHLHPAALPGHNSRSGMTAAITQQPLHPTSIRGDPRRTHPTPSHGTATRTHYWW
jgi:hypothetical protein